MAKITGLVGGIALALAIAPVAKAAVYDVTNSAVWTTTAGVNSAATFNYDYSGLGIPQAPGITGTKAVRLDANTATGSTQLGVTISPTGLSTTGDYHIEAVVWMNAVGPWPGGGTGSTQFFGIGSGYSSGVNYRSGATTGGGSGTWFAAAGEGGFSGTSATIRDFSAFTGSGAVAANFVTTPTVYSANAVSTTNPQDNFNTYYGAFPGIDAAAANNGNLASVQGTAIQTGTTNVGSLVFAWRKFIIDRTGDTVTWSIQTLTDPATGAAVTSSPVLIATLTNSVSAPLTLDGGTSVTYFDGTSGVASPANLDYALLASYSVTSIAPVPEPASIGLIAAGGLAFAARRRRRA